MFVDCFVSSTLLYRCAEVVQDGIELVRCKTGRFARWRK